MSTGVCVTSLGQGPLVRACAVSHPNRPLHKPATASSQSHYHFEVLRRFGLHSPQNLPELPHALYDVPGRGQQKWDHGGSPSSTDPLLTQHQPRGLSAWVSFEHLQSVE